MPVTSAVSNDMPVAPPSINRLGNKKLFRPHAAEKMPQMMSAQFLMLRIIFFLSCFFSFASTKAEIFFFDELSQL